MTSLYIETSNRDLAVYTADVTFVRVRQEIEGYGIVVRYAHRLPESVRLEDLPSDLPIVLPTEGYRARTSEGFVEVLSPDWDLPSIVGYMPIGKSLRTSTRPRLAHILPPGTVITTIPVPSNKNVGTAEAVRYGVGLGFDRAGYDVVLMEGQSNWVSAWRFNVPKEGWAYWEELPAEHKVNRFTPRAMLEDGIRSLLHHRGYKKEYIVEQIREGNAKNFLSSRLLEVIGDPGPLLEMEAVA